MVLYTNQHHNFSFLQYIDFLISLNGLLTKRGVKMAGYNSDIWITVAFLRVYGPKRNRGQ